MRVHLIAVGKLKSGPHEALARHYAERLTFPLILREVEENRPLPRAELKQREAALLLAALPKGAASVALDERGKTLASDAFAAQLRRWREAGVADLAFFIGGAEGLAEPVRQQAELVLALGPMTWPHLLVCAMLPEWLCRGQ